MAKTNNNFTGVKKNGFFEKVKNVYETTVRAVKNFFYDISYHIHEAWTKVFGRRQKSIKSGNVGAAVFAYSMIAYPFLQFLIFYVYVNLNSILLSFQSYNIALSKFEFVGFDNFVQFFKDIAVDNTMKYCVSNSLVAWLVSLVIGFPLNLTFAYVIYKKVPCSGFFQIVLFLPQILSSIVMSMMFQVFVREAVPALMNEMFTTEQIQNMFNNNLMTTFPDLLHNPDTVFPVMVFYSLWAGFGSQLILYSGAMSRIPDSIIEYGELEGISLFQEFFNVCIPMIWSTITIFLVTGVAGIFTNQLSLYNFYGTDANISTRTLGYHFFILVLGETDNSFMQYPYASAAGLIFSLIATPITLGARYLLEKYGPQVEF